jgi:type IV pilus assembly protein PilE
VPNRIVGKYIPTKSRQHGFTLIEIMIVVAMIAILSTIAFSSYRSSTVRANRVAAAGYILEVANIQERYLLDNRSYATGASALTSLNTSPPPEVSANYAITLTDPGGTAPDYQIVATPSCAQEEDDAAACGALTLNNLGVKGDAGGSRCWK